MLLALTWHRRNPVGSSCEALRLEGFNYWGTHYARYLTSPAVLQLYRYLMFFLFCCPRQKKNGVFVRGCVRRCISRGQIQQQPCSRALARQRGKPSKEKKMRRVVKLSSKTSLFLKNGGKHSRHLIERRVSRAHLAPKTSSGIILRGAPI